MEHLRQQTRGKGQLVALAGQGQPLHRSKREQRQRIVLGCAEVVGPVERTDLLNEALLLRDVAGCLFVRDIGCRDRQGEGVARPLVEGEARGVILRLDGRQFEGPCFRR